MAIIYIFIFIYMTVCVYAYMCTYACAYVCVCACARVYMFKPVTSSIILEIEIIERKSGGRDCQYNNLNGRSPRTKHKLA